MEYEKKAERRKLKLSSLIKRMVDDILRKEISDPHIGFVTLTNVKMSSDMKKVTIFVSLLGNERQQKESFEGLKRAQPFIRHLLSKKLEIWVIPEVEFVKDEVKAWRVEELLKEIEKGKNEREDI